jgi:hypothetical protein
VEMFAVIGKGADRIFAARQLKPATSPGATKRRTH